MEIFRRALYMEKELIIHLKKQSTPSMQEVLQATEAYKRIFSQMFTLLNILLAILVGAGQIKIT